MYRLLYRCLLLLFVALLSSNSSAAQVRPYFVTYDHHLEEPGNLEIANKSVFATQRGGRDFLGYLLELEYGVKGWWTTEFYLDGQSTFGDSTLFTGYRIENRFRPLWREHWINPVLYVEFVDVNEADRAFREVVGHGNEADHAEPIFITRHERERELELKLILSSNARGWNISENFITEKNLAGGAWEFGYSFGVSRPLTLAASPRACVFCRENFIGGVEIYGGLGDTGRFGFADTSHYVAPVLAWHLPNGVTFHASPSWGITKESHRFLMRFGVSHEISGFGQKMRNLFRGNQNQKGGRP